MKRWCVAVLACAGWVVSGACWSADVEHKRGDFKFFVGDAPAFVVPHDVPAQWDPKAPGVDDNVWRNWLIDRQVDRRGGKVVAYSDSVYEPIAQSNVGEAAKYTIEFNPEYQRLVLQRVAIRRDGAWHDRLLPDKVTLARRESDFESDMADGRVTALIVLDDVRVARPGARDLHRRRREPDPRRAGATTRHRHRVARADARQPHARAVRSGHAGPLAFHARFDRARRARQRRRRRGQRRHARRDAHRR